MATEVGQAYIPVHPDMNSFATGIQTGTPGALGALKGFATKATAILGAAFVGQKVFDFLGDSIAEAREAGAVTRQTEQAIRTTGGAANVTADQVANLSGRLSAQVGIDDELIQSGANLLLTFRNIRNEAGEGNDVFDQATGLHLDLAAAMKTDGKSAAIQLGKALNDPILGVTALGRAGVQFTADQKEQIKTLVETGNVLGAQKIILAEIATQAGGSAAAQADSADRASVAWGNFKETVGTLVMPVVEQLTGWLADHLPAATAFLGSATERISALVREHWPAIREDISGAVTAIRDVITGVVDAVQMIWRNFGDNIRNYVDEVWPAIRLKIEGALTVIRGVIDVITGLISGDWSRVWDGIKGILSGAWDFMRGFVGEAIAAIKFIVGVGMELLVGLVRSPLDAIKGLWNTVWSGLKDYVSEKWREIKILASEGLETIVGWIRDMPGRIASAAAGMWDGIKEAFRSAVNWIIEKWNNLQLTLGGQEVSLPFGQGFTIPSVTLKTPDIQTLHGGGVFHAPVGGEGLALLRDQEVVTTPETMGEILAEIRELRATVRALPGDYVLRARAI